MSRSVLHATFVAIALVSTFVGVGNRASAQVAKLLELHGEAADDRFGRVAVVGDLDGDGVSDFVVGAPRNTNANGRQAGAVYVYSGNSGVLLRRYCGDAAGNTLGNTVARIGDVDGDGYDDFAAAASSWFQQNAPQYVRLFSGRAVVDSSARAVIWDFAPTSKGDLALTLRSGGDVDGDGVPDVLLGCGNGLYKAYVVSGSDGSQLYSVTVPGKPEQGVTVEGVGDLTGDGCAEFLVGSYDEPVFGRSQAGKVWLYRGSKYRRGIGALLDELDGSEELDWFGMGLSRVGDVDGDGVEDFAVGASGDDTPEQGAIAGYVRVYSGASRALVTRFDGDESGELFGWWITAGDLDGDGVTDYAVSSRYAEDPADPRVDAGAVTAFSGVDGRKMFRFYGKLAYDRIGRIDATADFDGDGAAELLLGASLATIDGDALRGAVFQLDTRDELATSSSFGQGFDGRYGPPALSATPDPTLGDTIELHLGNSSGTATLGVLLEGARIPPTPTTRGGMLLVDSITTTLCNFPDGSEFVVSDVVPQDLSLVGDAIDLQLLELDPWATQGMSFSAGLHLVLGGAPW